MTVAVLVLCTTIAIIVALRTDDRHVDAFDDAPRRLPDPSARDLHAVTGNLGAANVPSWG